MKRMQILIDEELEEALARAARAQGTSKSALVRQYVRERLVELPPLESDPLWAMVGADSFEPEPIDDVVYR
jgi:hypothetical protein